MKASNKFTGTQLKNWFGPCVYGWYRPSEGFLYVGYTKVGLLRFGAHSIIGQKEAFQSLDEIHTWDCPVNRLKESCAQANKIFKPKYEYVDDFHLESKVIKFE